MMQQLSSHLVSTPQRVVIGNCLAFATGVILLVVSFYTANVASQILFLVSGAIATSYSIVQVFRVFKSKAKHGIVSEIEQLVTSLVGHVILTDRNGIVRAVSNQAKNIFMHNRKITAAFEGDKADIESAVYRILRGARQGLQTTETLRIREQNHDISVRAILFSEDQIVWIIDPVSQRGLCFLTAMESVTAPMVYLSRHTQELRCNPAFQEKYFESPQFDRVRSFSMNDVFTQPIDAGENVIRLDTGREVDVSLKPFFKHEDWVAFHVSGIESNILSDCSEDCVTQFVNYCPLDAVILDETGKILHANRAALATVDVPSLVGHSITAFAHHEDHNIILQTLRHVANSSASMRTIQFQTLPDQQQKMRYLQMFLRKIPMDKKQRIICLLVDKTKTKDLETQFAQSQKMQAVGKLAGGVAHDFNNLLTAISGHCDLLLLRHQTGDADFADLTQIQQNSNRAANLVRQLLAFSRQQTLTPKTIYLSDVLSDFRHLLDRLLGERIIVRMEQQPNIWPVRVDQGQLEQVIMNLAVNAQDAMPDGGTLTITTMNTEIHKLVQRDGVRLPEGQYVHIRISDTGMGMPEHVRAKVFEPFFTTKDIGKGTGLGLSTVYGIIKQMGGFVFVESATGQGATFDIYLPHSPETKEEKAQANIPNIEHKRDLTGKGTILLVEDEESVRAFASRALETRGYEVLAVDCGEDALDILEERDFDVDLMVSDVVMPEMDGPTLMSKVRERRPNMKIIFMSGYAEEAFRKNLDTGEKFEFIPKPFSLKQLATAVKDALGVDT